MTEANLIRRLQREAAKGGKSATARAYGVSGAFMWRVLAGQTPVTARLARAMGYERRVTFVRVNGQA